MKHSKKFRDNSWANSRQIKAQKLEKAQHKEKTPSQIRIELLRLEVANNLSRLLLIGEEWESGPKSL